LVRCGTRGIQTRMLSLLHVTSTCRVSIRLFTRRMTSASSSAHVDSSNATATPTLPVSGALFAVYKPAGPACTSLLNTLKPLLLRSKLFMSDEQIRSTLESSKSNPKRSRWKKKGGVDLKIGQGGTLDPNAEGVLVVGVGYATRRLTDFLECDKVCLSFGTGKISLIRSCRNMKLPSCLVLLQQHMTRRARS
jgi:hypothetical protein